MSQLVGAALPHPILRANSYDVVYSPYPLDVVIHPALPFDFTTPWWGGSRRAFIGDQGTDYGLLEASYWYEQTFDVSGAISKMAFTGVTRNAFGSILGSCTVKLFKTADGAYVGSKDALLYETVSDPTTGSFTVYSPYFPDTHYLVSYKVGTPDVEGTTVNTLIGA